MSQRGKQTRSTTADPSTRRTKRRRTGNAQPQGAAASAGAGAGAGSGSSSSKPDVVMVSDGECEADVIDLIDEDDDTTENKEYMASFHGQRCCAVKHMPSHAFNTKAGTDKGTVPDRRRSRCIGRELRNMRRSLPQARTASIWVRHCKSRPGLSQAVLTGPEDTPYDSGCFLFHMYCPPAYPAVPPAVQYMTTGGGTVRMNPNLYKNGRVCLSLLGTWQGPGWVSGKSTLLQVLVSIQSHVLGVTYPVRNEPGYEKRQDVEALIIGDFCGRQVLRVATLRYAMLDMLEHPPPLFEDVIKLHFRLKKDHIIATLAAWEADARAWHSRTPKHTKALLPLVVRMRTALAKL